MSFIVVSPTSAPLASNLTGRHVIDCVRHIGLVFGNGSFGIESKRSRKALRNVFGGDYVYRTVSYKPLCLLRREYYV